MLHSYRPSLVRGQNCCANSPKEIILSLLGQLNWSRWLPLSYWKEADSSGMSLLPVFDIFLRTSSIVPSFSHLFLINTWGVLDSNF